MALPVSGKVYTFTCAGASSRVLNLYYPNSIANGQNVCLWTADGSLEQQWKYSNNKLLSMRGTSFALDKYTVSGNANNNNADIWTSNDPTNQNIVFESVSGNTVKIKLSSSSLYLTAYNNANGTSSGKTPTSAGNVFWAANKSSTLQQWTFKEVGGSSGGDTPAEGMATNFPTKSFYSTTNKLYPGYVGECTWYCLGRAHEVTGITNLPTSNAKTWYDKAKAMGYSVTTSTQNPVAKSIAVWTKGDYGHVAFVERVSNGMVYYSEANWYGVNDARLSNGKCEPPPDGTDGQLKSATIQAFKDRYAPFAGCIKLV